MQWESACFYGWFNSDAIMVSLLGKTGREYIYFCSAYIHLNGLRNNGCKKQKLRHHFVKIKCFQMLKGCFLGAGLFIQYMVNYDKSQYKWNLDLFRLYSIKFHSLINGLDFYWHYLCCLWCLAVRGAETLSDYWLEIIVSVLCWGYFIVDNEWLHHLLTLPFLDHLATLQVCNLLFL